MQDAMALGSPLELTLRRYEVRYTCAGSRGVRKVWAPSEQSARRVLQTRPGSFGLDGTPEVTTVRELRRGPP